jgi:hypothetical protein
MFCGASSVKNQSRLLSDRLSLTPPTVPPVQSKFLLYFPTLGHNVVKFLLESDQFTVFSLTNICKFCFNSNNILFRLSLSLAKCNGIPSFHLPTQSKPYSGYLGLWLRNTHKSNRKRLNWLAAGRGRRPQIRFTLRLLLAVGKEAD